MIRVSVPYGKEKAWCVIPEKNFAGYFDPKYTEPVKDLRTTLNHALDNPIGSRKLEEIISKGKTVAVIIDDSSRPTPQSQILPVVLERIEKAGVPRKDIKIVVALGSHRYMTPEELKERVGNKVFENYKVLNSEFKDPNGLVYVGDTPEGVRIMANKAVIETDIHIGIGCLFPHPVMGWGGGGKILFPGIAGEETVAYFHLKASLFEKNYFGCPTTPVRDMMETWVDAIGLDFIVNVVFNTEQKVADIVAGHYKEAHREGVRRGLKISAFKVAEKVDVMVCSSHPADQDFWQSPKCAYAAEPGLKGDSGGTIVMVSPNYEGIGPHAEYPQCMGNDRSEEIAKACLAGEKLGDPLAIAVGNSLSKFRRRRNLIVVSDGVTDGEMEACGFEHYPLSGFQTCIDRILQENPSCKIGFLSNGAETFLY